MRDYWALWLGHCWGMVMSLCRLPSRDLIPSVAITLRRVAPSAFFQDKQERWLAAARSSQCVGSHGLLMGFICLGALVVSTGFAQASVGSYGIGKKKDFLQSSSSAPVSQAIIGDPNGPYHFSADLSGANLNQIAPAPRLTLPGGSQFTLTGDSDSMGVANSYANKSSLDAAFPNGSYTFTAGTASLPISLGASDAYPTDTPQITNGTWDGQGRLVVGASSGVTLNFNDFSQYSSGVGGTVTFTITAVSGTTLGSDLVSVAAIALSGYPSDPVPTAYTIPSGFLQADRTYYAELSYARIVNLNINFLPIVGTATFMHTTGFMISTALPAVAPVFTTQPASQSVTVGTSVVLSATASGNPPPTYQWRKDGVNINGASLASFTLNNVQLADAGSYTVVANNSAGMATSEIALLTVNPVPVAPAITLQPTSQTVTAGGAVSFTVTATGSPAPTYQWRKDAVDIGGATGATYTIASTLGSDAGVYTVFVSNSAGNATSTGATLTVNPPPVAPSITAQPTNLSVLVGAPASFAVSASGTAPFSFQWRKNSVNLQGATGSTYTIASTVSGDAGIYSVVVTNVASSVTSIEASLTVDLSTVAPTNAVISFTIE